MIMVIRHSGILIRTVICGNLLPSLVLVIHWSSPGIIAYWGGIKGYPVVQNSFAAGECKLYG